MCSSQEVLLTRLAYIHATSTPPLSLLGRQGPPSRDLYDT